MTRRGAAREETTVYHDDNVHGLNQPSAEEVARLPIRQQSNPTFALSQSLAGVAVVHWIGRDRAEHEVLDRLPTPLRDERLPLRVGSEMHSLYSS